MAAPIAAIGRKVAVISTPPPAQSFEQKTQALADATGAAERLKNRRSSLPMGLRYEFEGEITAANRQVRTARAELTAAATEEMRRQAQKQTVEAGRDLYAEQGTAIGVHTDGIDHTPAFDAQFDGAIADARSAALTATPVNLYEAGWQRNAQIEEAESAQWQLEQELAGRTDVTITPEGQLSDPALQPQFDNVQAQWGDVSEAFATELNFVVGRPVAHGGIDPLQAYRQELGRSALDPRYRDQVLSALDGAVLDRVSERIGPAIDRRVDQEAEAIEEIHGSQGGAATLEAIAAAKDRLVSEPITVGGMPLDPVLQGVALQQLNERLRPVYEGIAAQAPQDLASIAQTDAESQPEKYERALAVSDRLALYASSLPADLVPAVVQDSEASWAPTVAFLGENALPIDAQGGGTDWGAVEEIDGVVGNFSTVAGALAQAPGSDAAIDMLASRFAEAVPSDDPQALGHAFETGLAEGRDPTLAIAVVNKLAAGAPGQIEAATTLIAQLERGNQDWAETAQTTLTDYAENREPLDAAIANFPGRFDILSIGDLRNPRDPRALELNDAIQEYLEAHPEVSENDALLAAQIDADGLHLLRTELAMHGLSDEALALGADRIVEPLREYLKPDDNPVQLLDIYASTPSVQAEIGRFAVLAAPPARQGGAGALHGVGDGWNWMLDNPGVMSMPRNGRYLATLLTHPTGGVPGLRTQWSDSIPTSVTGVGFFSVAAATQLRGGLRADGATERVIRLGMGANFAFLAARDVATIGHMLARRGGAGLDNPFNGFLKFTGAGYVADPATNLVKKTMDHELFRSARVAQLASTGMFVVFDGYGLMVDMRDGRNGGVQAGSGLFLAGSAAATAEVAAGALGLAAWSNPLAIASGTLWTAGAVVRYQADRVEQSNRFESADMRRFLAHFGTRNEDGTLRTPGPDDLVEVSNFTDHDPKIEWVRYGDVRPDQILYLGLSADAVDELMNFSADPGSPVSGVPALDAFFASRGVDPRTGYVEWFSNRDGGPGGLNHEQRKGLAPAAQGVDPASMGVGIGDDALADAWTKQWGKTGDNWDNVDPELIDQQTKERLIDYVQEHGIVEVSAGGIEGVDVPALRILLGLNPGTVEQPAPSAAVQAAASRVIDNTALEGYEQINNGGFRPTTLDELDLWMKLHGYPPLPAASADPTPTGVDPAPANPFYFVHRGDDLWTIAARTGTPTSLGQLIESHNEHTPGVADDFDPSRADSNFFTANAGLDPRRDPDLIHPGEGIRVSDPEDVGPQS